MAENENWLRVRFFTKFWLRARKTIPESCRCRLQRSGSVATSGMGLKQPRSGFVERFSFPSVKVKDLLSTMFCAPAFACTAAAIAVAATLPSFVTDLQQQQKTCLAEAFFPLTPIIHRSCIEYSLKSCTSPFRSGPLKAGCLVRARLLIKSEKTPCSGRARLGMQAQVRIPHLAPEAKDFLFRRWPTERHVQVDEQDGSGVDRVRLRASEWRS